MRTYSPPNTRTRNTISPYVSRTSMSATCVLWSSPWRRRIIGAKRRMRAWRFLQSVSVFTKYCRIHRSLLASPYLHPVTPNRRLTWKLTYVLASTVCFFQLILRPLKENSCSEYSPSEDCANAEATLPSRYVPMSLQWVSRIVILLPEWTQPSRQASMRLRKIAILLPEWPELIG